MKTSSWPRVLLQLHADLLAGFPFESSQFTDDPTDVPLVKGADVQQGYINWDGCKHWPEAAIHGLDRYWLQEGDVIVAMDRPWVPSGLKWAWIKRGLPKSLLVQRVARLRGKNGLSTDYLRYVIGSQQFTDYISPIVTGVNVPHISGSQILGFSFFLPPLSTQRKIAVILSAYDDLIENNLRRIKILEEMTQNLYREWFVKFRFPGHEHTGFTDSPLGRIPEGWAVANLLGIAVIKYGKNLPTKNLAPDGDYPVYGAAKIIGRYTEYTREERTIICGCRGSVGEMQITLPKCFVTNNSFTFDVQQCIDFFWLYLSLKERGFTDVIGGAAQPQITLEGLSKVQILVPLKVTRALFHEHTDGMFQLLWNLEDRNTTLRRTRDLLLPRLISGEVDVSELDIAVPEWASA